MKTRLVFLAAALLPVASPGLAQERHVHPDCSDPDRAFWVYRLGHWHYPEILAELTQRNGARSRMELDAVAQDLVRSAVAPDPEWVVEQIRSHFEGDIRAGAEEAAREGICYDERDVDRMVAAALEDRRQDPAGIAQMMTEQTLRFAAHRAWSSLDPPRSGIPYAGEGVFEAAVLLFEETGRAGTLLIDLDRARAAALFQRLALRSGRTACTALSFLQAWDKDDPQPNGLHGPHPAYEQLRRESPERCPELDDPEGG